MCQPWEISNRMQCVSCLHKYTFFLPLVYKNIHAEIWSKIEDTLRTSSTARF